MAGQFLLALTGRIATARSNPACGGMRSSPATRSANRRAPYAPSSNTPTANGHRQGGPPLLGPGLAYAALTVVAVVLGASGPRPTTTRAELLTYLTEHSTAATVQATAVFAASIPLAVWTGVAYRRLRQLGVTAPGSAIGLAGGLLASTMLALSGLVAWTAASSAELGEPALLRALTTLSSAAGGPGYVPPFALLVAGWP